MVHSLSHLQILTCTLYLLCHVKSKQIISGIFNGVITHPNTRPQPLIANGSIKRCKHIKKFLLDLDPSLTCDIWSKQISSANNAKDVGTKLRLELNNVNKNVQFRLKQLIQSLDHPTNHSNPSSIDSLFIMEQSQKVPQISSVVSSGNSNNYIGGNHHNRNSMNIPQNNNIIILAPIQIPSGLMNNSNNNGYGGCHGHTMSASRQRHTPFMYIPQQMMNMTMQRNNSTNNINYLGQTQCLLWFR